jgi:hypothetical protein
VQTTDVLADLQRFEGMILAELQRVGLPTDDVVAELHERGILLGSLGNAMRALPEAKRGGSVYISIVTGELRRGS